MTDPITRTDLATMTPEQINTARTTGQLDHLLAPPEPPQLMTASEGADYLAAGHTTNQLAAEYRIRQHNHNQGA